LIKGTAAGEGGVSGTKTAAAGDIVKLTAYPFSGWMFNGWVYGGENMNIKCAVDAANNGRFLPKDADCIYFANVVELPPSETLTFKMPEENNKDIGIVANFVRDKYNLTASTTPTASQTKSVEFEDSESIKVSPKEAFIEWEVKDDSADKNLIDLIADRFDSETIILQMPDGTLVLVAKYSSSSSGTGTGTPGTGGGTGNGGGTGSGGGTGATPPADAAKYPVSVTSTAGGTAHANPASAAYQTRITLTATPNAGYAFKQWTVKSGDIFLSSAISSNTSFSMPPRAVALEAVFEDAAMSPNIARAATAGQATAQAVNGGILLQNLPQNAKIEIYSLQGKRIHSQAPILNSQFIQARAGMYIVKINSRVMKIAVK
jgi:hypothetical protein